MSRARPLDVSGPKERNLAAEIFQDRSNQNHEHHAVTIARYLTPRQGGVPGIRIDST